MLVSRHIETQRKPWSPTRFESNYHKPGGASRMSNTFDAPLTDHTAEWQGHYPYMPTGDGAVYTQPYDHAVSAHDATPRSELKNAALNGSQISIGKAEVSANGTSDDQAAVPKTTDVPSLVTEQMVPGSGERHGPITTIKTESVPTDTPALSMGSTSLSMESNGGKLDRSPSQDGQDDSALKEDDEEDDELLDDEEMVDGEAPSRPRTAAERIAQRRKMKRFRLTHQQTRFLMSEFAKQPHPDAAHRERLSREIPGLSPRQVQVWFQNRRAKIKRLTADDRDRMIKMRAVPDDFDNVQALHSPYGAVNGIGAAMTPGVDFSTTASYAEHMMRPLMVDVRRAEGEDHLAQTGLSPAFGSSGVGFSPDTMSPMTPHDRYYTSNAGSPMSSGPRSSNPFTNRQSSLDTSLSMHSSRQLSRPLQPLQLRETMSRSRADTLQSPLRSSMSWKGDALDYGGYSNGGGGGGGVNGRQASTYSTETPASAGGYEASSYTAQPMTSPAHMPYPAFSSSSTFPVPQARSSRMRAVSASLPLNLDLRTQFPTPRQPTIHSATSPTNRHNTISHFGGGASAAYSNAFPTGPLTAPIDYPLGRSSAYPAASRDYSIPQMSAPIAPPNDFTNAYSASMTTTSHTPMRDSFAPRTNGNGIANGGGRVIGEMAGAAPGEEYAQDGDMHQHQQHQSHSGQSQQHHRHDDGSMQRKRSFSTAVGGHGMSSSTAASQQYSATA